MFTGLDDVVTHDQPVRVIFIVTDDKATRLRCRPADDNRRAVQFIAFRSGQAHQRCSSVRMASAIRVSPSCTVERGHAMFMRAKPSPPGPKT